MLQRTKKVLLILMLVIAILLILTKSVNATTEIKKIEIKTTKAYPKVGEKVSDLDFDYKIYANDNIELSTAGMDDYLICYKVVNGNRVDLDNNYVFKTEESYYIQRWFTITPDLEIINPGIYGSDTKAYINGVPSYTVADSGCGDIDNGYYCMIENFFTFKETMLEKVNIKADLNLKDGEKVSDVVKINYEAIANNSITLNNKSEEWNSVEIACKEEDGLIKILKKDDVLEKGKTYVVRFFFVIPDEIGWYDIGASEEGDFLTNALGFINGEKVGYVEDSSSGNSEGALAYISTEYTIKEEVAEESPIDIIEESPVEEAKVETEKIEVEEKDITPKTGIDINKYALSTLFIIAIVSVIGIAIVNEK